MTPDLDLPGADLVARGLEDARKGLVTAEALLVAIGAPRLEALGLEVPHVKHTSPSSELALYELLSRSHPADAHGRYNALVQRLVSYERALEHERGRRLRGAGATPPG